MTASLLQIGARVAELHPYSWWLAWNAVHHLKFLLPHDKSYGALRHFIPVRSAGLFLDVGANDGISALSFRKFDPAYPILSLEPNTLLEAPLRRIRNSDRNFQFRMVGAGSKEEQVTFFVPVYRGIVLHTFTSANPDHTLDAIAESFGRKVREKTKVLSAEGQIVRIDDLDISPSIIKIDAEGFNFDVILGARETIARTRPFIMVELEPSEWDDLSTFLTNMNYRICRYAIAQDKFLEIDNPTQSRLTGERNVFAIPDEHMAVMPLTEPAAAQRENG